MLDRQYTYKFMGLWVSSLLLLGLALWFLFRVDYAALTMVARNDERHGVELARQLINAELEMLRGDTRYLAEQSALHRWIDTGDPEALVRLGDDLLAFIRHRGIYDQIRLIDEQGREMVRVNWNNGQPRRVPEGALQNKSARYYVAKTLALDAGDIYVSPFDLNIESRRIEQPFKPMIRLGTPVFDRENSLRGLVVVNYLGQRLLDRLRNIRNQNQVGLWLLNAEGYWLLGPTPELEWAFMNREDPPADFAQTYPVLWKTLQLGPATSQLIQDGALVTYHRFDPETSPVGPNARRWFLVSYLPESVLLSRMGERSRNLFVVFLLLAFLLTVISAVVAQKDYLRRKSEAAIRDREARFRGLLESAPDAIVIVDKQGVIRLINAQAEKWFGYSRDVLVGERLEILVPERFRERHAAFREAYSEHPVARPMGVETALYGLRRDGSEFPVEISLSPLKMGQELLVTSIIRDITLRRQTEAARLQMETRYQELVDNLPIGVFRIAAHDNARLLEANGAMVAIFEAESAAELLEYSLGDFFCDLTRKDDFFTNLHRQGQLKSREYDLKTLRGNNFHASVTAVLTRSPSGDQYYDGILEDISRRKEVELQIRELNETLQARSIALEATNQELEAFSYSVSHDLRAPLRAVDGFSRTLLSDYAEALDERGRDRLNRVRAAAQRMAMLIDDLLKLSRVSRAEVKQELVDLSRMARDVIAGLRDQEPNRAVRVMVQPELYAQGDPRLLRVMLENLLGNAWKFTCHTGQAAIEVTGGVDDSAHYVYTVRDNGAGFDMAYAGKLFGAFQRLHDTSEFSGTGIGLATVQRIISKHGGRIWAEGAVGEGAAFHFMLDQPDSLP